MGNNKFTVKHQDETSSIGLKVFLVLTALVFASAATVLIILSTSAATVTGRTPFFSIALVDGANTGLLGAGEQRWFKLELDEQDQGAPIEQPLTLIFTPGNDNQNRQIGLQIFEEKQLQFFSSGDAGQMANLGAGQIVRRDNNPETGELFWIGWLPGQHSYYIQITNGGEATIDYWLFTNDVSGYPLGEPEEPAPIQFSVAPEIETSPIPATGPIPLTNNYNQGNLDPGEENWYSFSITDADTEYFEEMALTMVVTPDNGQRVWQVGFEIFTAGDIQNWWAGKSPEINNIGAGSVVERDKNPLTGERIWSGWIIDGEVYYVRIQNNADIPMDYWLFTGDIFNPALGN